MNRFIKISRAAVDLVNPLNKANSTVRDILIPSKIGKQILQIASQLSAKGFTVGNIGEISQRIPGPLEKFVINSRDSDFQNLSEKDFCLIDVLNSNVISSNPPAKHFEWHQLFYRDMNIGGIILCQPSASMICGSRKVLPDASLWADFREISDQLACAENSIQSIAIKAKSKKFLLIEGIGLLVTGSSLKEAFWNVEIIERFCQVSIFK